jgi:hypothetical protein
MVQKKGHNIKSQVTAAIGKQNCAYFGMSNLCILGVILVFKCLVEFGSYAFVGAIALLRLQENLKKYVSAECHYIEELLEAYMETQKQTY